MALVALAGNFSMYIEEPTMTLAALLILIAVILFVIDGVGVNTSRFNLQSIGLAFFAGSFMVALL